MRLDPCATGCLAFRPGSTSNPSDLHHFNGRQGAAFTELALLPRLRMGARWLPVEWHVENHHPTRTGSCLTANDSITGMREHPDFPFTTFAAELLISIIHLLISIKMDTCDLFIDINN